MDSVELFLQDHDLSNADDIDSLIELASLVRQLLRGNRPLEINRIILHTIAHSCFEAFSWCMETLQEELENDSSESENFECLIGRSMADYKTFFERLQVDFSEHENGTERVYDNNGEVESFFNIFIYKTGYRNIRLVSSENFDTKDNDYVQYKLVFAGK